MERDESLPYKRKRNDESNIASDDEHHRNDVLNDNHDDLIEAQKEGNKMENPKDDGEAQESAGTQEGDADDVKTDEANNNEHPRQHFFRTCLRIAKNDPTLVEATEWPRSSEGFTQEWSDEDLYLVGHALTGNTHLRSLAIANTRNLAHRHQRGGVQALRHGLCNSQVGKVVAYGMSHQLKLGLQEECQSRPTTVQGLTLLEITKDESFQRGSYEEDISLGSDDMVDDPFFDDDDEEEDPRKHFYKTCLRMARNDPTLVEATGWLMGMGEDRQEWFDVDLFLLGHALTGNTHVRKLQIESTNFYDGMPPQGGVPVLCQGIHQCPQLIELVVIGMSNEVHQCLFLEVGMLPNIQQLTIYKTPVLINCLTDASRFLTHLSLIKCYMTDTDMLTLSTWVSSSPSLSVLSLSSNGMTDIGTTNFCQNWKDDSLLQKLQLCWNDIGADGALTLLQATRRHTAFCNLDLSCNKNIGHAGLALIGRELPTIGFTHLALQQCVKALSETNNSYEKVAVNAACRSLSDGLRGNASLVALLLGANSIDASGAQMLMQAVSVHPLLETLSLADNKVIGFSGMKLIGMELANTKLKEIELDGVILNYWPEPQTQAALVAGQALLDGVRRSSTLTKFSLPVLPEMWNDPIQCWVNLNATCRPLLRDGDIVPAIWPNILAHFHRRDKVSHVYFSLREQPWLVVATATTTAPQG
jgi:hypothetical protein